MNLFGSNYSWPHRHNAGRLEREAIRQIQISDRRVEAGIGHATAQAQATECLFEPRPEIVIVRTGIQVVVPGGQIHLDTAAHVEIPLPLVVRVVVVRVVPKLAADGPKAGTGVHFPETAAGLARINVDDRPAVDAPTGIELVQVAGRTVHARKRIESGDIDTGDIDARVQPT